MSAHGKWIEQFGFSKAANGSKTVSSETLFNVLTQGQLAEADYLPWAQSAFELPLLQSEFFAVPVDPVFWDRVKDVHAWSAHLYPVADWDGVLLIACVEPPATRLPIRDVHQFVLAGARDLGLHWAKLNPKIVATSAAIKASVPLVDFDSVTDPVSPTVNTEMPDGFGFAANVSSLNVNLEMPDGFDAPSEPKPASDLPDGFAFSTPNLPPISEMPDGFGPPAAPSKPAPVAVAPPPPPPPPPAAPITMEPAMEMTQTGFTITNSPDPDWVELTDPKPLKTCQTLEELATHTLSAVARHFTGGLIFVAKSEGMTTWRFAAPFRTPRKPFGVLSFEKPSLFRIVDRTHLPYHGHTSPAAENDRFFKAYLGGKAPAHVTLVPVILNKKLLGLILGVADSEIPFRHILPIMEALAKDFGENYARLETKAVAA